MSDIYGARRNDLRVMDFQARILRVYVRSVACSMALWSWDRDGSTYEVIVIGS